MLLCPLPALEIKNMYDQTILDRHARMVTNAKFGKNSLSAPFFDECLPQKEGDCSLLCCHVFERASK